MIIVAGATGSLGSRIVEGLQARRQHVRAIVRPASEHAFLQHAGVPIMYGDLTQPASLARALRGARVLITTASMSKKNDDTVENVDLNGNLNLIAAARDAGVQHVVFVSTIGASPDHPLPLFRAKGVAEQALRESGITFTILQPNVFMDVWFPALVELPMSSGEPVTLVGQSLRRHSFVAERDVAAFAVAAIARPAARNSTIVIGGPDALTWRDVVTAYSRAAGRELEIRSVAPGEPIGSLPPSVVMLAAALETYDSPIPMEATAAAYGVKLTSVDEFARARVNPEMHA